MLDHADAAIRDVIDRYAIGLDRRDWELVRTCFAADCLADYGRTGRWTDRETLIDALDEPPGPPPTSTRC